QHRHAAAEPHALGLRCLRCRGGVSETVALRLLRVRRAMSGVAGRCIADAADDADAAAAAGAGDSGDAATRTSAPGSSALIVPAASPLLLLPCPVALCRRPAAAPAESAATAVSGFDEDELAAAALAAMLLVVVGCGGEFGIRKSLCSTPTLS